MTAWFAYLDSRGWRSGLLWRQKSVLLIARRQDKLRQSYEAKPTASHCMCWYCFTPSWLTWLLCLQTAFCCTQFTVVVPEASAVVFVIWHAEKALEHLSDNTWLWLWLANMIMITSQCVINYNHNQTLACHTSPFKDTAREIYRMYTVSLSKTNIMYTHSDPLSQCQQNAIV